VQSSGGDGSIFTVSLATTLEYYWPFSGSVQKNALVAKVSQRVLLPRGDTPGAGSLRRPFGNPNRDSLPGLPNPARPGTGA